MLCFRNFLLVKNCMDKKGERGKYRSFPSKNFSLKSPKNFVWEPFSPSLISGIEKIYASEAYVTIFRPKFFVSHHQNFS